MGRSFLLCQQKYFHSTAYESKPSVYYTTRTDNPSASPPRHTTVPDTCINRNIYVVRCVSVDEAFPDLFRENTFCPF